MMKSFLILLIDGHVWIFPLYNIGCVADFRHRHSRAPLRSGAVRPAGPSERGWWEAGALLRSRTIDKPGETAYSW